MKIGLGLLFVQQMSFKPEVLTWIAESAEELGFESVWAPDHVVIPTEYQTRYPYSETGKLPNSETDDWPDPMVALGCVAGVTKRIKLGTCVTILPYHHPLELGKQWATLDVISNGRAILGVGSGWLKEEFDALGLDFHQRGARTDESIEAMRAMWCDEISTFKGKHFSFERVRANPKPIQKGGVPIFVGGHSPRAARRAARYGNGFFPVGTMDEIEMAFRLMRAECDRIGRNPDEIELMVAFADPTTYDAPTVPDTLKRYADLGITRTLFPFSFAVTAQSREGMKTGLGKLADSVIARQ